MKSFIKDERGFAIGGVMLVYGVFTLLSMAVDAAFPAGETCTIPTEYKTEQGTITGIKPVDCPEVKK